MRRAAAVVLLLTLAACDAPRPPKTSPAADRLADAAASPARHP